MNAIYQLIREVQGHPFFNFFLAVSLVGCMTFSLNYFAIAEETTRSISDNTQILSTIKLDMRLNALEAKTNSLEVKIQSIESEIFHLEGVVDSGNGTKRDQNRLSGLKSELGRVSRELRRIDSLRTELMKNVS